mgnify:CR=1 FL=1
MYELPDLKNPQVMFDSGVTWHLTVPTERMGRFLVHYEAMKLAQMVPGEIVECGVFKGESLMRFAHFRNILGTQDTAKIIGFDNFNDEYPDTEYEEDQPQREEWVNTAGPSSISISQLQDVLDHHKITNYDLVGGDISTTVPEYVQQNGGLRVSLLNIDCDFVEPTYTALKALWPHLSDGAVVLLDNYGGWGSSGCSYFGDTKGVDDFFNELAVPPLIKRFPWASRPCYFIKY